MGAYLSKPNIDKETEEGEGNSLAYGASCMQGWRVSQEDAHNCVTALDEKSSLFAVYDGHGGAEVAIYLAKHFPQFLKSTEAYKNNNWEAALHDAFVGIDAHIKTTEAITEIQKIAKKEATGDDEEANIADYEEENVAELYEEATMPIQALLQKYTGQAVAAAARATGLLPSSSTSKRGEGSSSVDRPGSSKSFAVEINDAGASSSSQASKSSKTANEPGTCDSVTELPMSSTSIKKTTTVSIEETIEVEGDAECSSSSRSISVTKVEVKLEDTAEAEIAGGSASPPEEPHGSNGNGDVEPSSSTNDVVQENSAAAGVSSTKSNGVDESCEPDSTEADCSVIATESPVLNGSGSSGADVKANGEADSTQSDNLVKVTIESPKRKGKVHPPPIVRPSAPVPTRSSQRAKVNDAKVYENFLKEESATSDSEDEDTAVGQAFAHDTDSDDDEDDTTGEVANSSSTDDDEDEDMEEEEDEDDDESEDLEDEEDNDGRILSDLQEPGYDSGSTAVVAFFKWENDKLHLYVANAGDSRCVVSRGGTALDMSQDHKPEDETEARRIVKAGGKVTQDGRVNGGLNLSRAIGDHSYKQNQSLPPEEQMITPVPDIKHEILDPSTDDFVILACDGVWNSMSSQEVVEFVSNLMKDNIKISKICEQLFDACLAQDTSGDGTGCDNMTAIIVKLPSSAKVEPTSESSESSKRRLSTSEAEYEDSKRLKADTD